MKLYYIPFACSQAVHIMLNELQMTYELVEVDSNTKETAQGENYLEINPNGYVPALKLDNQQVLTEVPAILQYLQAASSSNTWARSDDPIETARLQSMLNFLSSELHKAFVPYWYQKDLSGEQRQQAFAKLDKRMSYLESELSDGRDYLLGRDYSSADIYAYVLISWCGFHDIDIAGWHRIKQYFDRLSQRPAVKKAIEIESAKANSKE